MVRMVRTSLSFASLSFTSLAITTIAICTVSTNAAPPLPEFTPPALSLSDLASAGVLVPEAVATNAVRAYLDAYAEALAKAVEEGLRIAPVTSSAYLPENEALLGVRDTRRLAELETRVAASEAQLRAAFFAQIAAGSPSESHDAIRACEALRKLREPERRLQGGITYFPTPDDISGWLRLAIARQVGEGSASMEERRRITILAAVNADQRVAATMVAVKAARDDRERKAQRAEELGVVGKSLQQLFEEQSAASEKVMREAQRGSQGTVVDQRSPPPDIASELTESPSALSEGGAAWQALVEAQLATYRAMEPQLTESDRKRLRDYWMPRLMGLRDSIAGLPGAAMVINGREGYVQEYLRTPGLDDAGREADLNKVRAICRAWLKDDAAIVDAGFASLLKTGKSGNVDTERQDRAMGLRGDLAAIRGLEWLSPDIQQPMVPDEAPAALSQADIAEFGKPADFSPGAHLAENPDAQRDYLGLPRGMSMRDGEQLATLLRLDDAQRAILMTVLEDARTSWETTVEPLVRAGHPAPPPRGLVMDEAAYRAYSERSQQAERARAESWIAAKKADAAFFEALAAALGERYDRSVLACAHASRQARRLAAWKGGYHAIIRENTDLLKLGQLADLPTALLELPVANDVRARACAAGVAIVSDWVASVYAWADAEDAVRSAQSSAASAQMEAYASGAEGSTDNGSPAAALADAKSRATQARRACVQHAARLDAAIVEVLPESERQQWSNLVLALRFPMAYRDLRPLRKAVDVALACVPAERRAEVRARVDAVTAELATRIRRIGARAAEIPEQTDASFQYSALTQAEVGFTAAQVVQALPLDCRGAFELRDAARYIGEIARLSQPTANGQ